MDEASPAEAEAAPEKKRPFLHRVPTSLLVALVGIALTAWLLPAFTRQWDDRQKAHELKAALATQLAVATAKSVIRSREELRVVLGKPNGGAYMFEGAYIHLEESWLADSIEIEAKLRADFHSSALLAQFHGYNRTMQTLFQLVTDPWTMWDNGYGDDGYSIAGYASKNARLLGVTRTELGNVLQYVTGRSSMGIAAPGGANDYLFTEIANGVLAKEQALAVGISAAHAEGYSTTTHDLLNDLIP